MSFFKNEKKYLWTEPHSIFFTVDIQLHILTFGTIKIGTFNEHGVLLINSKIDDVIVKNKFQNFEN